MATLTILRNTLKLNACKINKLQFEILTTKQEASAWRKALETAFFAAACIDCRKLAKKLVKAVELQKRVKVEIAAIFRNERIIRKYTKVFGKCPTSPLVTSFEQEAMLDALLAEHKEIFIPAEVSA